MKKHRISILLFIIVTVILSPVGAGAAAAYSGASSWAVPELDKAAAYGLITDRIKNNMASGITREEFAEIAVRLYEIYTGKKAAAGNTSFSDTTNPEILKAANLGLTSGIGDGKFGPGQLVTREQMATILLRALRVINPDEDYSASGAVKFTDDGQIESWAQEGVYYCSKAGIIKGIQNKDTGKFRFDPDLSSSREVAVIVCTRAYELFAGKNQPPANGEAPGQNGTAEPQWNESIIILDEEFNKDNYAVSEVNGESYIFLPFDRFKYVFKVPAAEYKYPEVSMVDGEIHVGWKDAQGEVYMEVLMELGSSVAYLNQAEVDIVVGPYKDGDTVFVPVNLFIEMFEMQSVLFQGRLCFEYPNDFPKETLEGSWSYSHISIFTGYKDMVTGVISLPSFDWSYTFNPDGTYRMAAVSSGSAQDTLILQSGKYQVIGNVIVYYDQYETLYKGSPLTLKYEKKHMGDRLEFSVIDNYNEKEDKIELDLNWYHRYQGE